MKQPQNTKSTYYISLRNKVNLYKDNKDNFKKFTTQLMNKDKKICILGCKFVRDNIKKQILRNCGSRQKSIAKAILDLHH